MELPSVFEERPWAHSLVRSRDDIPSCGENGVKFFVGEIAVVLVFVHETGSIHDDRSHGGHLGRQRPVFDPIAIVGVSRLEQHWQVSHPSGNAVCWVWQRQGPPWTTPQGWAGWDLHFRPSVQRRPNAVYVGGGAVLVGLHS